MALEVFALLGLVVGYNISGQPIGPIFKGQSIQEVDGIWFI
jgi:hypothetical protein